MKGGNTLVEPNLHVYTDSQRVDTPRHRMLPTERCEIILQQMHDMHNLTSETASPTFTPTPLFNS
jgi:hypothetical protein